MNDFERRSARRSRARARPGDPQGDEHDEHHKQAADAYDRWIAELCEMEESAMERDRLRAKLEALRAEQTQDHVKVVGRMGNMTYAKAWKTWASKTAVYNQAKNSEGTSRSTTRPRTRRTPRRKDARTRWRGWCLATSRTARRSWFGAF